MKRNDQATRQKWHRLVVYRKALELLAAVRAAQVTDAKLCDEALRAAKGTCLNIIEDANRRRGNQLGRRQHDNNSDHFHEGHCAVHECARHEPRTPWVTD